ncbi:hypothetical protein POTOM_021411 [Populus tomentosa]|uniref:Uncharacterized protein n=1 Tax=Populus tomentosa TaxID=118781 RepID=A0A8X7ZTT5_POPTO|nr:hypothetical protein POTOM_021411 [Populus tomentosa]
MLVHLHLTRRAHSTYNVDKYNTLVKPTTKSSHEDKKVNSEGLPVEDSPYVNYGDLEDYKRKAYGTEGHLEPKTGGGAGATDAPTISGGALSS